MAEREGGRRWLLIAIVLAPVVFNAIALWPEVSNPLPNLNDDTIHLELVQREQAALIEGNSPFDPWAPDTEIGFPSAFHYQHLPHLAVVVLYYLLLGRVSLLTLFNLVRWLLMAGFPITVYWSMRTMEFSEVAAAIAAGFASLISANVYGLEYGSYVWGGLGMYTQLWGTHLFFIALALTQRLLRQGTGWFATAIACALLGLSHLVYSYIFAIAVVVLFLLSVGREAEAR
jgi:hypothetical protein